MEDNNRNFILAIVLSICVLFVWQVFYAGPKMEEQRRIQEARQAALQKQAQQQNPNAPTRPTAQGAQTPSASLAPNTSKRPSLAQSRETALSAAERIRIETPTLRGSISLIGARLDDIVFKQYNVSVEKNSPNVVLFSPSKSPKPYYAEYGWVAENGVKIKLPDNTTTWKASGNRTLTKNTPVVLTHDNGEGLIFKRTISIDDQYMFSIRQEVQNNTNKAVTLHPYALISRHGRPPTENFFILHEGPLGVFGEEGLNEISYDSAIDDPDYEFKQTGGWLGITDKYWAAVLIPDQKKAYSANIRGTKGLVKENFQTDYLLDGVKVQPNQNASVQGHLFAGVKQTRMIDDYEKQLNIELFDRLIDWGWFYWLTKPLFFALDFFYNLVGNFGVSIIIVTIIIKLLMFPLANKSYISMSRMKKLQPDMERIRDRYKDDRMRQQQELMNLYKKHKINPMAGCLPIFIQIPVFFALYKVLFITIDMRHAPFFGWIQDLSAPDPTTLFNLFGLIPWDPPSFLIIGIWPILMGITMWVQMQLNPQQPDPIQQQIFTWMPVVFTFLLATFPAGLVIYWTWNNLLSVLQQWYILKSQGVEVDLLENLGVNKLRQMLNPDKTKSIDENPK
ncbi:MAG: membrane protein insertase YidC [Pseudomonadota bacterium]